MDTIRDTQHPEPLPGQPTVGTSAISNDSSTSDAEKGDSIQARGNEVVANSTRSTTNLRTFLLVLQLCAINFLSAFTSGIITIGLPTIATSISLPRSLYLWPSSVYGLASGAPLLLAGSIADLIGAKHVEVVGASLMGVFALACGFAETGIQLVVFRALQGVGFSMHLPASVSLIAAAVPQGKSRNVGFACLGLSLMLGFSAGLVISGIMIEKTGWRSPFYLAGAAMLVAAFAGQCVLPQVVPRVSDENRSVSQSIIRRLSIEVDWAGGMLASGGLTLLAYVLALIGADISTIHHPSTAMLLTLGLILLIAFPFWMRHRHRSGHPALIPNALWKKLAFTSTCVMVAISFGVLNSMEVFSSLYFQEVQNTSTLFAALRLLPSFLFGGLCTVLIGLVVDKVSARWLVAASSIACAGAPLLMALVNPEWSYWYMEFWAQLLASTSADVFFTVGLLIVSDQFPAKTQALAGAVYNTAAQLGWSIGMGICQTVALDVGGVHEKHRKPGTGYDDKFDAPALLKGYRAAFWTMFALMIVCGMIGVVGLRKVGRLGGRVCS